MNTITQQKIIKVIDDAFSEENNLIIEQLKECYNISWYKVPQLERDIKKIKKDNEVLHKFISAYREFISILEKPYWSIERISHQEYHDDWQWWWGWYFEEWYKVITEWLEDEIFILESWNL